jgi:hypothetical protein
MWERVKWFDCAPQGFVYWKLGPSVAVWRWWNLWKVRPDTRWLGHYGLCPWKGLMLVWRNESVLTRVGCHRKSKTGLSLVSDFLPCRLASPSGMYCHHCDAIHHETFTRGQTEGTPDPQKLWEYESLFFIKLTTQKMENTEGCKRETSGPIWIWQIQKILWWAFRELQWNPLAYHPVGDLSLYSRALCFQDSVCYCSFCREAFK